MTSIIGHSFNRNKKARDQNWPRAP